MVCKMSHEASQPGRVFAVIVSENTFMLAFLVNEILGFLKVVVDGSL